MPTATNGVEFPDLEQWIPSIDLLNDAGQALLNIAEGALEVFGRKKGYERIYLGHAKDDVVFLSQHKQLIVSCQQAYAGKPGAPEHSSAWGQQGRYGMRTGSFVVRLSAPWPIRQDAQQATNVVDIASQRQELWRDGIIVWSALIGFKLGSVKLPTPLLPADDRLVVSPMAPWGPDGQQAGWRVVVDAQLP